MKIKIGLVFLLFSIMVFGASGKFNVESQLRSGDNGETLAYYLDTQKNNFEYVDEPTGVRLIVTNDSGVLDLDITRLEKNAVTNLLRSWSRVPIDATRSRILPSETECPFLVVQLNTYANYELHSINDINFASGTTYMALNNLYCEQVLYDEIVLL